MNYHATYREAKHYARAKNKREMMEKVARGEFPAPINPDVPKFWRWSDIKAWDAERRAQYREIPHFMVERDPQTGFAKFECPVCGKVNHHGIGDGHRQGHCRCWKRGYYIVTVERGRYAN